MYMILAYGKVKLYRFLHCEFSIYRFSLLKFCLFTHILLLFPNSAFWTDLPWNFMLLPALSFGVPKWQRLWHLKIIAVWSGFLIEYPGGPILAITCEFKGNKYSFWRVKKSHGYFHADLPSPLLFSLDLRTMIRDESVSCLIGHMRMA